MIGHPLGASTWEERCQLCGYEGGSTVSFVLPGQLCDDAYGSDIVLLPVTDLTFAQLCGLRDLLAKHGDGFVGINLIQVRARFCDGQPHLLFHLYYPPLRHVSDELRQLGIAFSGGG